MVVLGRCWGALVARTCPARSVWSLSPSPVSPLPLQVPLERHDGGIRLRDNQVSSLWSERRGQPLRAGRWRQRRGHGHCWRRRRQGSSSGRQQRRDEPCGAAALPAATGRSWRPSWATGPGSGHTRPLPTPSWPPGALLWAKQLHFNLLGKVQLPGTSSAPSSSRSGGRPLHSGRASL